MRPLFVCFNYACITLFAPLMVLATDSDTVASGLNACPDHHFAAVAEHSREFTTSHPYCDSSGKLRRLEFKLRSTGTLSQFWVFDSSESLLMNRDFDSHGVGLKWAEYENQNDGTFIRIDRKPSDGSAFGRARVRRTSNPLSPETRVIVWDSGEIDKNRRVSFEDHFDPSGEKVIRRAFLNSAEKVERTYEFNYRSPQKITGELESFIIRDSEGSVVGEYIENMSLDISASIRASNFPAHEVERRIRILSDTTREPVVVMDTGFDLGHEAIGYKFWTNPNEPIDGKDNDLNGKIDDIHGWYLDESSNVQKNSPVVTERSWFNPLDKIPVPFSHGSHVASLAVKDLESFGLVGFSGHLGKPEFLGEISNFLKKNQVRFANMSFGYGDSRNPFGGDGAARIALSNLIASNADTLFFVAAGNDTKNFDDGSGYSDYPAEHTATNLLVVGATDQSEFDEAAPVRARPASFTNLGRKSVDVLAPGDFVKGASLGGGKIAASGTSFASPLTMNLALKIRKTAPQLSSRSIKELIMKTVYIPNLQAPFEVLSGGVVFPARALSAAKLTTEGLSVEDAALQARRLERESALGESRDAGYLRELVNFWRAREL